MTPDSRLQRSSIVNRKMHDRTRIPEYIRPLERFPLPHPIPERLSKGEKVTIAACFKFDEGILFCADTKITTDAKTTQGKIYSNLYAGEGSPCGTVFALAGSVRYATSAIADCEGRISRLNFLKVSVEDIRKEIESALVDFYQRHIYPHPERELVDFGLLVGVWLRGETRIYMSQGTVVLPVSDYECIGTGAYLAKYLIRQFFESEERGARRSLQDVAILSEYVLSSVMDYDESCGGEAEFYVMKHGGEVGFGVQTDIHPCEELFPPLQRAAWQMLRKLAQASDEMEADIAIEDCVSEIRNIGNRRTQWLNHVARLLKKAAEDATSGGGQEAQSA
jgi:20S proteasome alpha/beta subunit